jgi:hypothetical protein
MADDANTGAGFDPKVVEGELKKKIKDSLQSEIDKVAQELAQEAMTDALQQVAQKLHDRFGHLDLNAHAAVPPPQPPPADELVHEHDIEPEPIPEPMHIPEPEPEPEPIPEPEPLPPPPPPPPPPRPIVPPPPPPTQPFIPKQPIVDKKIEPRNIVPERPYIIHVSGGGSRTLEPEKPPPPPPETQLMPTISPPPAPTAFEIPVTPLPPTAEQFGTPPIPPPPPPIHDGPPPIPPPPPPEPPMGEPQQRTPEGSFTDDISSILKGIKLPERFKANVTGEPPAAPPTMPQVINASPSAVHETDAGSYIHRDRARSSTMYKPLGSEAEAAPRATPPPLAPSTYQVPAAGGMSLQGKIPQPLAQTFELPDRHDQGAPVIQVPVSGPPVTSVGGAAADVDLQSSTIVSPMRTLKEDLMHVVRDQKVSLVKAVALEQDKKAHTAQQPTSTEIAVQKSRRGRFVVIIFISIIFLILGGAAIAGVYYVEFQNAVPSLQIGNSSSIISSAEQTVSFPLQDLSSAEIKRLLQQARGSSSASLGSLTRIVPTLPSDGGGARPATTAEFLKALSVHAPEDLSTALSDQFFFGIHTIDKNAPVIVIPVVSYDTAFADMLKWEDTMNDDLQPAFTAVPDLTTDDKGLPVKRKFGDVVMRNYDTRALKDDSGTIELYYSFPTPKLLVIAESPHSFDEILSRLQGERRL